MANCNDTTTGKPTEVSNIIKAGATLIMEIRDEEDALMDTLQAGSEFLVSSNIVTFNFVPNFPPDTYFYDLQCTFANGLRKTLIGGKFKVLKQITTA